jgi:hypothetical protein
MKKVHMKAGFAICAVILSCALAACENADSQASEVVTTSAETTTTTAATETTTSTVESTAEVTEIEAAATVDDSRSDIGDRYLTTYQKRIPMTEMELTANGKTYQCVIFMYHVDNETPGELYGQCAAELFLDDELIDRCNLVHFSGLSGPAYSKDDLGAYFTVLNLENENDVLAFMSPSKQMGTDDNGDSTVVMDATFYAIDADDQWIRVTRPLTDQEVADQREKGADLYWFFVTDDYDIDGNRVTFHAHWDVTTENYEE